MRTYTLFFLLALVFVSKQQSSEESLSKINAAEEKKECTEKIIQTPSSVRQGPGYNSHAVKNVKVKKGDRVCVEKSEKKGWSKIPDLEGYVPDTIFSKCEDKDVYGKISRDEAIAQLQEAVNAANSTKLKAVAAAKYLAYNFDGLPYFSGGGHKYDYKNDFKGIFNPRFGECRLLTVTTGRQVVGQFYPYGLDCSGYVTWALYQAGCFKNSATEQVFSANNFGTFGTKIPIASFRKSKIPVDIGDLVWQPKHVGIIIEKDGDDFILAEEGGTVSYLNHSKVSKNKSKFTHIISMGNYYKKIDKKNMSM